MLPFFSDYRLKYSTVYLNQKINSSGRSAQKIRLLIFKIAKTAETLATPTTLQSEFDVGVADYRRKQTQKAEPSDPAFRFCCGTPVC